MWPINNYSWTPWYIQSLGNMWVRFLIHLSRHSWEENFLRFILQKNHSCHAMWPNLPNHVTKAARPCDLCCQTIWPMIYSWTPWYSFLSRWEHVYEVSPRSVQPLWRSRFLRRGEKETWGWTSHTQTEWKTAIRERGKWGWNRKGIHQTTTNKRKEVRNRRGKNHNNLEKGMLGNGVIWSRRDH